MNPLAIFGWVTKLGGALTGVDFNAIGNVLKTIGQSMIKYWYLWIIGILIVSNGLTGWQLKHTRDALKTEVAAHAKDILDFKNAQAEADAKAQTITATLTQRSKDDATKADANYSNLLAQYRVNLLRYRTSQGGTQQAGDHQLSTTQSGNGPSASTELSTLVISQEDAGICAVNTARLQAVHDWAIGLPKEVTQ